LFIGYQACAEEMAPPSTKETIDPRQMDETPTFDNPGVKKVGENEYEVVMTLQVFSYTPDDIEILAGSTVHITLTKKDVVHGFEIGRTNVNAMVMPGYVQKITKTFAEPGEYLVLCNEYCGSGHELMSTTITVK